MTAAPTISMKMDTATIERGFKECPTIMAKYVKEGIKRVLLGFRKDFFQRSPVQLAKTGRGLGVPRFWPVDVKGAAKLDDLFGVLHTGSPVAFAHETGATVRPSGGRKWLAVPILAGLSKSGRRKKGFASPAQARKQLGMRFVTVRTRRGNLVLKPKVKGGRRRLRGGALAAAGRAGKGMVLGKAAFLLVPQIKLSPRLKFLALWEQGLPDAERRFGERIDDAVAEAFRTKGVNLRGS